MIYAYLQQGQDTQAEGVLQEVNNTDTYQDSFASAYGIAAVQARAVLERGEWDKAAILPLRTHQSFPWDKYPWFEAITHFARGLGAARSGDLTAAQQAHSTLHDAYERAVTAGQKYWAIQVDVQRQTVSSWMAYARGESDRALTMMSAAAALEDSVDKHPVTPGSVLPARELYGEMLMLAGKPKEALKAYETALAISPNRFNSLYGASHAAERAGQMTKAQSFYTQLVKLAGNSAGHRPHVATAQSFLAIHGRPE